MKRLVMIVVLFILLPGCQSFGITPGYQDKHPDLLDSVRHFYREPLWTRNLHCHRGKR